MKDFKIAKKLTAVFAIIIACFCIAVIDVYKRQGLQGGMDTDRPDFIGLHGHSVYDTGLPVLADGIGPVFAHAQKPGRPVCPHAGQKDADGLFPDRVGPVSYTHLDVYKRQAWPWPHTTQDREASRNTEASLPIRRPRIMSKRSWLIWGSLV